MLLFPLSIRPFLNSIEEGGFLKTLLACLSILCLITVAAFHAAIPLISEPDDAAVAEVFGTSSVFVPAICT